MNLKIEIHNERTEGFTPTFEAAAIYVNAGDKVLFLKIAEGKSEAGFWGLACDL